MCAYTDDIRVYIRVTPLIFELSKSLSTCPSFKKYIYINNCYVILVDYEILANSSLKTFKSYSYEVETYYNYAIFFFAKKNGGSYFINTLISIIISPLFTSVDESELLIFLLSKTS